MHNYCLGIPISYYIIVNIVFFLLPVQVINDDGSVSFMLCQSCICNGFVRISTSLT